MKKWEQGSQTVRLLSFLTSVVDLSSFLCKHSTTHTTKEKEGKGDLRLSHVTLINVVSPFVFESSIS